MLEDRVELLAWLKCSRTKKVLGTDSVQVWFRDHRNKLTKVFVDCKYIKKNRVQVTYLPIREDEENAWIVLPISLKQGPSTRVVPFDMLDDFEEAPKPRKRRYRKVASSYSGHTEVESKKSDRIRRHKYTRPRTGRKPIHVNIPKAEEE